VEQESKVGRLGWFYPNILGVFGHVPGVSTLLSTTAKTIHVKL